MAGQHGPSDQSAAKRLFCCPTCVRTCAAYITPETTAATRDSLQSCSSVPALSAIEEFGTSLLLLSPWQDLFKSHVNKSMLVINNSSSFNSVRSTSTLARSSQYCDLKLQHLPRHAARRRSVHFPRCIQVHLHRAIRGDRDRLGGLRRRNTSSLREPPALHAGGMRVFLNQRYPCAPYLAA